MGEILEWLFYGEHAQGFSSPNMAPRGIDKVQNSVTYWCPENGIWHQNFPSLPAFKKRLQSKETRNKHGKDTWNFLKGYILYLFYLSPKYASWLLCWLQAGKKGRARMPRGGAIKRSTATATARNSKHTLFRFLQKPTVVILITTIYKNNCKNSSNTNDNGNDI